MTVFQFGDFSADDQRLELRHVGRPVRLQRLVLETIFFLLRARGRAVAKSELMKGTRHGALVTNSALSRAIMLARRALSDPSGKLIATVHGFGYRITCPIVELPSEAADTVNPEAGDIQTRVATRHATWASEDLDRRGRMRALQEVFERALGAGCQVVVSHEEGLAKSALLRHFAEWMASKGTVFVCGPAQHQVSTDTREHGFALWAIFGSSVSTEDSESLAKAPTA